MVVTSSTCVLIVSDNLIDNNVSKKYNIKSYYII